MDGDWKVPLIIGCSVGGFLLILAVLIVSIYLCRRSRQRKKLCYDSNLSSRDATVDSGYTTFSLQKPGMPPLPASAQSHPHGGLWTTQAVSQAQTQWAQPIIPVEAKSQSDKKTSSSSSIHQSSTEDIHKKSNGFWKDRKSSHMHESTESMESATGSSSGSYGSQSELILRDQKPESKHKNRENKKSQRRSELLEPDMSVIEEESNLGSKVGHHKVLPPTTEPEDLVPQHQVVVQVRHHHPDEMGNPSAAVAASAAEMDSRQTIYPPSAAVNVDAVVEIQPKQPATRTLTNTSEDKQLILEAFSFLDEFEE